MLVFRKKRNGDALNEGVQRILFNKMLNEELGVNAHVSKATEDTANALLQRISTQRKVKRVKDGVYQQKGEFDINLQEIGNCHVNWTRYIYSNDEYNQQHTIPSNKDFNFDYTTNTITVVIRSVKGELFWSTMMEGLQHELEHLFQSVKGNKRLSAYKDFKSNREMYNKKWYGIAKEAYSTKDNKYTRSIYMIIYLSQPHEQDAYANGAYSYLMQGSFADVDKRKEHCQMWYAMINLKNAIEFMRRLDDEDAVLSKYLQSYDWVKIGKNEQLHQVQPLNKNKLITMGEQAYKELMWKFGRIYTLAKDRLSKNVVTECEWPVRSTEYEVKRNINTPPFS